MMNDGNNQMRKHVTQKRTDIVGFRNLMKYCNEIGNITQVRKWPLKKQVQMALTLLVRQQMAI